MKVEERATQVWAVLAWAARNRQVLTYGILSRLVGVPAWGFAQILDLVQRYCLQKGLPPLTILVVNKDTGLPGKGFVAVQDIPKNQTRVFEHGWLAYGAPSPDDFGAAMAKARKGEETLKGKG